MSALPFRVEFGYCCQDHLDFATFAEALACYRGYTACKRQPWCDWVTLDDGPRLVNIDNIDGAEDSSAASQAGLTAEEWEAVENAG